MRPCPGEAGEAMNRRDILVVLASATLWPPRGFAQQTNRVPVVGMLITHPPVTDPVVEAVRAGLRQFGYEDGRNIRFEVRTALGQLDRVPALVDELVLLPADVIVIVNDVALRAVKKATSTIPIVMLGYTDDPVTMGWIESYSRPGTNITGLYSVDSTLFAKRLEILRETLPEIASVAVLWDPSFGQRQLEDVKQAAIRLGIRTEPYVVRGPKDLEPAFAAAKRRILHRPPAQRRESRRSAGRAGFEVQACGEPQYSQGPRNYDTAIDPPAGR